MTDTDRDRPTGADDFQSVILENLSQMHRYQDWLCSVVQPYLGDSPLEIGCGNGDYAARLLARGQPRITLSEIDTARFAAVNRRFRGDRRVQFTDVDLGSPDRCSHSSIYSFNVLEHIEDDIAALRSAHRLVRPGGYVVHLVPAFPIGMSRFDRKLGHFRRYRKKDLIERAEQADLLIQDVHYVNAPGLIAWLVMMRLMGGEPRHTTLLGWWDRFVIPIERRVENHVRPPFGQSAILVARTPASVPQAT